jgi:hypothetical protein
MYTLRVNRWQMKKYRLRDYESVSSYWQMIGLSDPQKHFLTKETFSWSRHLPDMCLIVVGGRCGTHIIIIKQAYACQLNCFTQLRALLVLPDRGNKSAGKDTNRGNLIKCGRRLERKM